MVAILAAGGLGMLIGVVMGAVAGMVCTCLIFYKGKEESEEEIDGG